MAVRPVVLVCGQSNSGPTIPYSEWLPRHSGMSLDGVSRVTVGPYDELFTLPSPGGGLAWAPPHNAPVNLKGRAIRGIRYLTFYHPEGTGYSSYPHRGRVVSDAGATANTASAFYVTTVFDAAADTAPSQVSITRVLTGETRAVLTVDLASLPSGAGSRITLASAFTKTPTVPAAGEEFLYEIRAMAPASAGATAVLISNRFGVTFPGSLSGLRMTSGANVVTITGWDDATGTITFTPPLVADIVDGALITLAPLTGVEFHKFALWLPWSPLRGDHVIGKENAYPRGFDYPGHVNLLTGYAPNVANTAATVAADLATISYHVGLAVRLRELLGEEVYMIGSDFGGSTLATLEFPLVVPGYGWHDSGQQAHWTVDKDNNCVARTFDAIDAGIAAAALEGDTLAFKAIVFVHGESDASLVVEAAERYENNLDRLKTALRNFVKSRGLWAGDAKTLPWIQPKVKETATLLYASTVNRAIQRLASGDPYMRTFSMDDATLTDGFHYSGDGGALLETRVYESIIDVQQATATTGVIDICNLALSFLGDSTAVLSIDPPDGSAQAAHCARLFQLAFDECLKLRRWSFASRRLDLTELADVTPAWLQWPYAYVLPSDFLRVTSLLPPGALDDNIVRADNVTFDLGATVATPFTGVSAQVPHSIELDAQGRSVLLTVQTGAVLRYIARVPARACPQDFRVLVAWRLAEMLAGPIIKGDAGMRLAEQCRKAFAQALVPKDDADADSRRNDTPHVPFTLQGR